MLLVWLPLSSPFTAYNPNNHKQFTSVPIGSIILGRSISRPWKHLMWSTRAGILRCQLFWCDPDKKGWRQKCELDLSYVGPTVTIISSHGAVARSAAAETHTWDFPAWNLRSTFNLPSFTTSTVNYLGAVRSTARHLSYFSSTSTSNCCTIYTRSLL